MRRTMKFTRGAALAASLCLYATGAEADDPTGPTPYPSSQQASGPALGGASSQYPGAAGVMGVPGAPGSGGAAGAVGPDGAPLAAPGDGAGSGAFGAGGPGAAGAAGAAGAGGAGFSQNTGGVAGGNASPPGIIGDFQPLSRAQVAASPSQSFANTRFPHLPSPVPPQSVKGGNPGVVSTNGTGSILFKLTGLKISDNQSPRPQDRIFYSFNYFDNLNASVNRRLGTPVENLQVYHQLFGIEKTFLDGRASVGFRVPLNTITFKSTAPQAVRGGTSTTPGDLAIFLKYAFYSDADGNLISGGLQVQAPTGPNSFGGNKNYQLFRDTQIQPFIGCIFARDRFYFQGFSSINVPSTSRDVTLLFNDVGIGYYVYRAQEADRLITAIVPTAEAHLTTPLNHRGFSINDKASTPDILNMTVGANLELRRRAVITAAYVTPVTGPKPFNAEFVLLFNLKFGGAARSTLPGYPTTQ